MQARRRRFWLLALAMASATLEAELLGAALYKALRSHKIDTANISVSDADAELTATYAIWRDEPSL